MNTITEAGARIMSRHTGNTKERQMSNERDELAGLLFTTDNSKAVSPWSEWEHAKQHPRLSEYVYAMADALLAAGYRKPRTITTQEELDALPNGTVVMDGEGEVARKLVYGWRVLVSESGFDAWLSDPLEETYLPATVIHEGEML